MTRIRPRLISFIFIAPHVGAVSLGSLTVVMDDGVAYEATLFDDLAETDGRRYDADWAIAASNALMDSFNADLAIYGHRTSFFTAACPLFDNCFFWNATDTVDISHGPGMGPFDLQYTTWSTSVHRPYENRNYVQWTPSSVVPLPAAAWLMGSGLIGLMGYSRKNKSGSIAA